MSKTVADALKEAWAKLNQRTHGVAGMGADTAASFVPGSGLADYMGQMPSSAGGKFPSFSENIGAGNYADAGFQVMGAAGDMAAAVPLLGIPLGAALKVPAATRRLTKAEKALELLKAQDSTRPRRIVNQTKAHGGYSVNLPTGEIPTSGLMMGRYKNTDPRNTIVQAPSSMKDSDVVSHTAKNLNELKRRDMFLGTWKNTDDGNTYLDVSKRFENDAIRQATKYGEKTGQLKGWDVKNAAEFPVGNWEEFIRSDEYQRRLDEMMGVGKEYLTQHPTPEWWDMHGTCAGARLRH